MLKLTGMLVGLLILLGTDEAMATPMPGMHDAPTQEFQKVEQPLGMRLGVTAAGLALIGLELWWFLGSKPRELEQHNEAIPPSR